MSSTAAEGAAPPGRIVVAMSGGVDSSVAAAVLRDQGHDVVGVTLQLQDCREAAASRSCCGSDSVARARAVAAQLAIPHYVLDCVAEFADRVLAPAWRDYDRGHTPSPCLLCNERIKFGRLLDWARGVGAAQVATGHYARLERAHDGALALLRARDAHKDQSYFLAGLTAAVLERVRFPLSALTKEEVRARARALGLATAATHDSQDACLVGPYPSFAEMLRARFGAAARHGPILDADGRLLGRHPGLHHFTVGQRRGLGLAEGSHIRRWVVALRPADNAVIVSARRADLLAARFVVGDVSFVGAPLGAAPMSCEAQVRYRHRPVAATVVSLGQGRFEVALALPVAAVTPGQAAVFYDGARVLGRGFILGC